MSKISLHSITVSRQRARAWARTFFLNSAILTIGLEFAYLFFGASLPFCSLYRPCREHLLAWCACGGLLVAYLDGHETREIEKRITAQQQDH